MTDAGGDTAATISIWELPADGSPFREITDDQELERSLVEGARRIWVDIDGTRGSTVSQVERVVATIPALDGFRPALAGGGENPPRLPPKAKTAPEWIFGRFYWLHEPEDATKTILQEIHLIVGRAFAITVRHPCLAWPPLERVVRATDLNRVDDCRVMDLEGLRREVERLVNGTSEPADRFGLHVAAVVLDKVVDAFFDTLDRLRGIANGLEVKVLNKEEWLWKPANAQELDAKMVGLRRILRQVRWAFMPADEVDDFQGGPFLLAEGDQLDPEMAFRFADLDRETERALATVKDVTEQVDHIVATRDSLKTDRLNRTLYVLTVVATVLLVPTLIAGIYGMNFEHMPELRWRYGYLGSIIAMVVTGGGLWLGIRAYLRRGGKDLE